MTDDLVKRLRDKVAASRIYDDDEELLDEAADRIEAQDKHNKELEAALHEIAVTHISDQPAAAYGDREYWAYQQHAELRRMARAALGEKK